MDKTTQLFSGVRKITFIFLMVHLCALKVYAQRTDTIDMYYYKNSLYNHLETGQNEANASTNVGNWIARMASQSSTSKTPTLGSVFGFFTQWTVPPRANNFHSEISTPHLSKWTASWTGAENIDLLAFVPDNFDGQYFDPSDTTNMGAAYVTKLLYLIDEWELNAPNLDRKYVIYTGWPSLNAGYGGSNSDPATITDSQFGKWRAYGLGAYQDWMELFVTQLKTARPTLKIELHNISKALLMCHGNTVVKDIDASALFEDLAPHGRSTWYFLAAIAEYIELFNEKPPVDFSFKTDWGVDSMVTSNYEDIVDYIWNVLVGGTVSVPQTDTDELENAFFYPNPTRSSVYVITKENNFEINIIDAVGKTVLNQSINNQIDLRNLPSGTYYIELKSESYMRKSTLILK